MLHVEQSTSLAGDDELDPSCLLPWKFTNSASGTGLETPALSHL